MDLDSPENWTARHPRGRLLGFVTHPKDLLINCFFCSPTVRQIIQFPSHFPQHPPGVGCGGEGGGGCGGAGEGGGKPPPPIVVLFGVRSLGRGWGKRFGDMSWGRDQPAGRWPMPVEVCSHCVPFFVSPHPTYLPRVLVCSPMTVCAPSSVPVCLPHLPAASWSLPCHPPGISVSPVSSGPAPLLCPHLAASPMPLRWAVSFGCCLSPPTRPRGGAVSARPPAGAGGPQPASARSRSSRRSAPCSPRSSAWCSPTCSDAR